MKKILFIVFSAMALTTVTLGGQDQTWRGTIMVGGGQLGFEAVLIQQGDGFKGVLNILGKGSVPLTEVELMQKSLHFANPGAGISFKGTLSKGATVARGKFSEGSQGMHLTLTKFEPVTGPAMETWQGNLAINDRNLPMRVRIHQRSGERIITFDSLAEGKSYRGVWTEKKDGIELKVPFIQLIFQATADPGGTVLEGHWSQPGRNLPFRLELQMETNTDPEKGGKKSEDAKRRRVKESPIPDEAYSRLAAKVQSMVDNQEIVGGELLIIQHRNVMFRQAFGFKDLEKKQPMENDAVYCVRSMTKPLVGTAIQMLIDEGRLQSDTRVADILPAFKKESTKQITIDHLLTHTSGLPLTTISKPLVQYEGLTQVAAEAASVGPQFEPGSQFEYSDAGSDTLGAVVAAVTSQPVERFIEERILEPLGMKNSFTLLGQNEAMRARIPSAYSGGTAAWTKHWDPTDPPIFPIFLTSQSLYSTTSDYARFLAMWIDGGKVGNRRMLSERAVSSALAPHRLMASYPINFGGLKVSYGRQWLVGHGPEQKDHAVPMVFGHDGSDGTHAWAWPGLDLMVLYFTQSRGTLTGVGLSEAVQTLLVEKNMVKQTPHEVPAGTAEEVAGLYWDETAINAYYVVKPMGDRLSVARPGKMFAVFKSSGKLDHYQHEARSDRWLEFVRDEDGTVTAMRTSFGGAVELDPRHSPPLDLPSVEQVIAMVREAHHIDRLANLGGLKMSGGFKFKDRGMEGSFNLLVDGERERRELSLGAAGETVMIDEGQVWYNSTQTGLEELSGQRRQQILQDRLSVRYGDWRQYFDHVEVLKRLPVREMSLLLVRVVPEEGFGSTLFVDETSGRIVRTESLLQVPGLGIVGVETNFDDFREVDGALLPFYSEAKFSTKHIGRVATTIETVETGVKVAPDSFSPEGKHK